MRTLGIDIGGGSVKTVLREDALTTNTAQSWFYNRPTADQLIDAVRATLPASLLRIDAVGLCVPGLLDERRERVVLSVNLPCLMTMTLREIIARATGLDVRPRVVNDGVAAAQDLAAGRQLCGRLLVLALGTGVGAAVVDDGVPLIVEGASPGHIGQLDVSVDDDPPIGPDGGAGGLEGYFGVPALAARYGDAERALATMTPDDVPLRALVRAIRICHAVYRPHHVVLAGGIGSRLHRLLPALRGAVEKHLTGVARAGWTFACADDDFHAARGAAAIAADK